MTGLDLDWTQIAAAVSALGMLFAGFAWIVREIVRRELVPRLDAMASNMNGRLDTRIDDRIDNKLRPLVGQLTHINDELSRNLDGYNKAS